MYELNTKTEYISNIRIHFLYCLLYGLSILAALWQHGHAMFTCVILCITLPVLIVPLIKPFRNELTRSIMQITFPLLALFWLMFRLVNRVPSDKFLIESLTLAGYAFSFTLCKKDRAYFLLICGILLIYGAVYPRGIFIHLIPVITIVILLIFYLSRANALCQTSDLPESKAVSRFSWMYMIPQVILMILLTIGLFLLMPSEDATQSGYFTSNINNNQNYSPPKMQDWFKTQKIQQSPSGTRQMSGRNPSTLAKFSNILVSAAGGKGTFNPSGDGAGLPGNDLLFTVNSDTKLYWLVNLYDTYDGKKWKMSKKLKKQRFRHKWDFQKACISASQAFVIRKWASRSLPSAFMATYYSFPLKKLQVEKTFFGRRLQEGEHYPEVPFQYTTHALIPYAQADPELANQLWWERIPKKDYLKLPKDKISTRLKQKARGLTRHAISDYDKAIALRDYLRNNFDYLQTAQPTPDGYESADYFIFELKEGHCEYFASAMVVLARLSGLPARIATGYSPGNFNIMTKQFEVYEYHAHAWTQIFIEGKGWLTFDPTPPGEIISRTTPLGIGSLKDPFGDEWQVKPPELASLVQQKVSPINKMQSLNLEEAIAEAKKSRNSALKQFMMQIPTDGNELQDTFAQLKASIGNEKSFLFRALTSFKTNFNAFINTLVSVFKAIGMFFYGINGIIVLVILILAFPAYLLVLKIIKFIKTIIKRRQCEELFNDAVKNMAIAPNKCIESCYNATRNLLEIAGYPNENKLELFDYGTSLQKENLQLSKDVLAVFYIYSQMSYSTIKPKITDSEHALHRSLLVRTQIDQKRFSLF